MTNKSEVAGTQKRTKREWVKPVLKVIKAGSAEVGVGTVDDADPGTALTNS